MLILFGKLMGALCALFDIAKAFFSTFITSLIFPGYKYGFAITATACILGHIFPFYMCFRGGKGLACLGGVILFYDWKIFLIMLGAALVLAIITDYICFVPICASAVFPIIYAFTKNDVIGALILAIISVVILIKHFENLQRIRNGTELHLSFLWNKNSEFERIRKSVNANDAQMTERFLN